MISQKDLEKLLESAQKTLIPAENTPSGSSFQFADSPKSGQLAVVRVEHDIDVPEHSHPYDEFCIILQGRLINRIQGQEIEYFAGDFIYEPANTPHSATVYGPYVAIDFFAGPRFQPQDPSKDD